MTSADTDIAVGRVGRAHGVRGEVFVQPWTDSPDDRFVPGAVFRTEPVARGPLAVAASKVHSGKLVVQFDGISTRTSAEELRGTVLVMDAGDRPPIEDPDEFYDTDLIGLVVRDNNDSSIGVVTDVLHSAAGSVLAVDADGREVLVPFRKEFVPVVDLTTRYLSIDPPEGLLDL